jgi:hypothetical protein
LSGLPFDEKYPVHTDPYLDKYVNLFTEKSPCNRTCDITGIDPWYCSCLVLNDIDPKHYEDPFNRDELGELIQRISEEAVVNINNRIYLPYNHNRGIICQELTLNKVVKAYGLRLDNLMEQIQVEISVNENKHARFEVYAVVSTKRGGFMMRKDDKAEPFVPYPYRNFKANIRVIYNQIIGISRKDAYAGTCEKISRANGYKSEYCICREEGYLRENYPALFMV